MRRNGANQSIIQCLAVSAAFAAGALGCEPGPAKTPAPSPVAAATSTPGPTTTPSQSQTTGPTASAAPIPTNLPAPETGRWVAAGATPRDFGYGAQLVALPNGGAVLLGFPLNEDGDSLGVLAAERWDPTTGWQAGASTTGREGFAAVALRDGRVLVAGGANPKQQSLKTAAVYDPVADAWMEVGSLDQPRTNPAMAVLPDGHVLIVGGFRWDRDQEIGLASIREDAGNLAGQPLSLSGGVLPDVILPPRGPALATAELFDPATGTWSSTGPMRFARTGPAIAVLAGGRVLVAGADGDPSTPTRIDDRAYTTAEVYNPKTGRFGAAGTLAGFDRDALARGGVQLPDWPSDPGDVGTLVPLTDGGAVLVGRAVSWKHAGEVVWSARLAPDLNSWRAIGEPFGQLDTHDPEGEGSTRTGVSRQNSVVVSLPDGSLLVAGGSPGYSTSGPAPVSVVRYDPARDAWANERRLPEARELLLGACLADGTVLVVGGRTEEGSWAAEAHRYGPRALATG